MAEAGQQEQSARHGGQGHAADHAWTLGRLAQHFGLQLVSGSADVVITGVGSLENGGAEQLAYADGRAHAAALRATGAGAVIVPVDLVELAPTAAMIAVQPQLAFARIAALFEYNPQRSGVDSRAVVHPDARIGADVAIGPHAVIGAGCVVGNSTRIGANTVVDDHVLIGAHGLIGPNVTIGHHVRMGERVRIGANTAIGGRGFGLVHNGSSWEYIPQLGTVVLGDDVEVGASSTIDRGALDNTVIGDDVHIDNQVQIGHNCKIGAHTVIAGSSGIAGSCTIGMNCLLGGAVEVGDHIRIVDNVMITGATQVATDITEPGAWSSTFRAMPVGQWRRLLARFRKLGRFEQRLKRLEKTIDSREQQD